jgi:branched-chain amino acid transport system ATP-binding protein
MSGQTGTPLIVEGMSTGYNGRAIVHGVSFRVEPGRVTALLGHNGAGKTTTLKAITGLLPLHSGSVWYADADISKLRHVERVRRGIVYLPQEHAVFAGMTSRRLVLPPASIKVY